MIEELEGRAIAVEHVHPAAADALPTWVVLDVGKARDELGWAPEIGLHEGLHRLLEEGSR
jgi:nucleoside-diphosphate-sugar epimerase